VAIDVAAVRPQARSLARRTARRLAWSSVAIIGSVIRSAIATTDVVDESQAEIGVTFDEVGTAVVVVSAEVLHPEFAVSH
jgi:hypothetical protein